MKLFELSDYVDVLAAVGEADLDLIMVGGNAVSFYAEKYRLTCSELNPLLPVLSKDTDWLGSVEAGMKLANRLQANWKQNPRKGGMLGLSLGHVELPGRPEVKVEILGHILGADSQKVRETALSENYEGHRFRVISPFLLYEAKGTNLVRIPQRTEARTREDFKQFTVMGFVVREVLRELVARADAERALLKACNRLADFWLSTEGVILVRAGVTNPRQVLPVAELERHSGTSVQNFITKGLPQFERQLAVCLDTMDERALEKLRMEIKASETDERTKEKAPSELGR